MNYHIGRLVLSSLCVGAFVAAAIWWCSFCRLKPAKRIPPKTARTKSSNTQLTENKTIDVVIHQHSRKLLKMDILMSETCWAHSKWNKIASDIKLVFHSSIMRQCLIHNTVMLLDIIHLPEACTSYGALCPGIAAIFRWLSAASPIRFYVKLLHGSKVTTYRVSSCLIS